MDDLTSSVVFGGDKIADAGIENVEDVAAYVPNLVLSETDTGVNIVIRGIGAGVNQGFDQSVGLYVDGVPLPRGQMARAPFLDLENLQVLRGPQYVLDGNYSIAGSVHMITAGNTDEFDAGFDFNYVPSQSDRKILFTLGSPIVDDVFGARLALQYKQSTGYIENVTFRRDEPQSDELLARSVFTLTPTDFLKFKLKVEQGSFDTRGRQIELISDGRVPHPSDFPEFDTLLAPGGAPDPTADPRGPIGRIAVLRPSIVNEADYAFGPIRVAYDIPDGNDNSQFYWAGRTYLERVEDNYLEAGRAVPRGLRDATVDFRRAADVDEFSENDTLNITLNTELELGEYKLKFTGSYIDYEVNELIDGDFTAAPMIEVEQSEEYTQNFYRLDFETPRGEKFEFKAGISYLDSELVFGDLTRLDIPGPQNQSEVLYAQTPSGGARSPGNGIEFGGVTTNDLIRNFASDSAFPSVFGRAGGAQLVAGFQVFVPDRQFEQEHEIGAAYFQGSLNFNDTLKATFGARYTKSEKQAVRDFAFLLRDGSTFIPQNVDDDQFLFNAINNFGALLNFQQHSDRANRLDSLGRPVNVNAFPAIGGSNDQEPGRGRRTEERFLPSVALEWFVNTDLSLSAAVRKANKLGGYDARSSSTPDIFQGAGLIPGTFEFEDEEAISYELGVKYYLPFGLGQVFATAFYTEFEDLQVSSSDGRFGTIVQNAGAATSKGVEVEGLLQLDRFSLQYSLAYIDFQFDEYLQGSCPLGTRPDIYIQSFDAGVLDIDEDRLPRGTVIPIEYEDFDFRGRLSESAVPQAYTVSFATPNGNAAVPLLGYFRDNIAFNPAYCDFAGETAQYVADVQGTFTINYELDLHSVGAVLKPTADIIYNSGYQTSVTLDDRVAQDEYFQINGRLALKSPEDIWEVALVGENLTNEKIVGYASETPLAVRNAGSVGYFGFIRPPRSVGLNFRYKFY